MRARALMCAGALAAVAMTVGPAVTPAGASRRSGDETIRSTIYEAFPNGQPQGVGPVRADGVFDGTGVNVELPPSPSDPQDASRILATFRNGSLTVLATGQPSAVPHVDHECNFTLQLHQTADVVGGTGVFAHATGHFVVDVRVTGAVPRNPDGSCVDNESTPPLFDTGRAIARGHLSL